MKRRAFLKGAGAVVVLVAGGGVWRAFERGVFQTGKGPAYEPWKDWRSETGEGPLPLVRAAILAANPHNSQPWLFRVTASRIDLYADLGRNLGAIDPYRREMYVGVGCALENLLLAASAFGYEPQLTILPDSSDPTHAARIELVPGVKRHSVLYSTIPRRHTNRGPYDRSRPLSSETLESLRQLAGSDPDIELFWFTSEADRRRIGDLIVAATEAIIADTEQVEDSAKWYRFGSWRQLQRHRDGLTLDAMGSGALLRGIAKMLPPQSREFNDRFWLRSTREVHVATAAAFGLLTVRDPDDRSQRIRCGRAWQRVHLWATEKGLAMHPLNQMPERAARERVLAVEPRFGRALEELIGNPERQALMAFRAGFPTREALASPRRPLAQVLQT